MLADPSVSAESSSFTTYTPSNGRPATRRERPPSYAINYRTGGRRTVRWGPEHEPRQRAFPRHRSSSLKTGKQRGTPILYVTTSGGSGTSAKH
jgi:hypothetical protein